MEEKVSKEIRIGDKIFIYEKCNEYQRVIYVKMDKQLNKVKELQAKHSKDKGNKEVQRAIGVLEFLIERFEAYRSLDYIDHMYGENCG